MLVWGEQSFHLPWTLESSFRQVVFCGKYKLELTWRGIERRWKGYLLVAILPPRCVILLYFHKRSCYPCPWSPLGKKFSGQERKGRSTRNCFCSCMQGTWRGSCLSPSSADTAEKVKFLGFLCLYMVLLTMRMYTQMIFIQEQLPITVKYC